MTNIDRNEVLIKFFWTFAKPGGDVLLEDTEKRYAYHGKIHEQSTVYDFAKIMMPVVTKTYIKNREEDISQGLDLSCLRGIAGVAEIIASFAFCVDDMRMHFRLNILSLNIFRLPGTEIEWIEFEQAPSVFIEAIGSVQDMLFQHQLVEFMVYTFSSSLSWLDNGEGETNNIVKTLAKLLYDTGTSVLVTTKSDWDWSWEPIYDGGQPMVGVVYDIQDFEELIYQGLVTRLCRNMVDGDEHFTYDIHFIGWDKIYDESWDFNASIGFLSRKGSGDPKRSYERPNRLIFTRGTYAKNQGTYITGNEKYFKDYL